MKLKMTFCLGLTASLFMGCAEIDKLKEDIEKITNQTVLSGLVLGAEDFDQKKNWITAELIQQKTNI